MSRFTQLAPLISALNHRLGVFFISYLVLLMAVILLYEMSARYLFSAPTIWAPELAQQLFGAYVMLSGGYLLAHKGHVSVDLIYNRFSPRGRAAINLLTSFLFFAFLSVLLLEGWTMARESVAMLETSSSAWNPPVWPLKLTIPLGAALILLQGLADILADLEVLLSGTAIEERGNES